MKTEKSKKCGLRVLNDRVVIKEDPIDWHNDVGSGLTTDVTNALKDGKLVIPDTAEFYAKKYPCTGVVQNLGKACTDELKIGDRVIFARMGVLRMEVNGEKIAICTIHDIHAVLT